MAKRKEKILICGAGIAGPCLANLLNRVGFKTVVIEKAPHLRIGGQNIDIHGAGRKIVECMGLLNAIKAHHTSERGMRMVDSEGKTLAEFPQDPENDQALTKELEILRSDLAKVFYESTRAQTEYRFGISVKSVTEDGDYAQVEFSNGRIEEFDLVVSAEGVGSPTRKLLMDGLFEVTYMGAWMGFFRIPKISTDDEWAESYLRPGGPGLLVRPSTPDSRGVLISFKSDDSNLNYRPQDELRQMLRDYLRGGGWQCDRIINNLDYDDDLYLGPLVQIKAKQWSKSRFTLVGDAGYSPSVLTGRGTTLAITGAYILAGELSKTEDMPAALKSYESILRPFAETCQIVSPELLHFLDFKPDPGTDNSVMTDFAQKEEFFDLPIYGF
jgi:2-polyprenyl-6-methoxyphenol hydroxylase-like FAD-dependent oxidoreductase